MHDPSSTGWYVELTDERLFQSITGSGHGHVTNNCQVFTMEQDSFYCPGLAYTSFCKPSKHKNIISVLFLVDLFMYLIFGF